MSKREIKREIKIGGTSVGLVPPTMLNDADYAVIRAVICTVIRDVICTAPQAVAA